MCKNQAKKMQIHEKCAQNKHSCKELAQTALDLPIFFHLCPQDQKTLTICKCLLLENVCILVNNLPLSAGVLLLLCSSVHTQSVFYSNCHLTRTAKLYCFSAVPAKPGHDPLGHLHRRLVSEGGHHQASVWSVPRYGVLQLRVVGRLRGRRAERKQQKLICTCKMSGA